MNSHPISRYMYKCLSIIGSGQRDHTDAGPGLRGGLSAGTARWHCDDAVAAPRQWHAAGRVLRWRWRWQQIEPGAGHRP